MKKIIEPFILTLTNFFQIVSIFSPYVLLFIISIYSIFTNKIIKLIFLFIGLVITILICYILKIILSEKQDKRASITCNFFPIPISNTNKNKEILSSPSTNSAMVSFILMYIIYPMYNSNNYNYKLLIVTFFMFILNFIIEIFNYCSSHMGVILGILIGFSIGLFYYLMLTNFENSYFKLTYSSSPFVNNKKCQMTITNKYVCNDYGKN